MVAGRSLLVVAFSTCCWMLCGSPHAEEIGLKAPEGFEVSLFAPDELAHDIYSMTIDSHGRVVVAGAGYVKILHDDNADGRADRATVFSKVPASGAHGMCFDGPDLICTGDNALMRLRDSNDDGSADGEPIVLTNLRHPEHGANGVVQGPDGWFYVICGNDAGVSTQHVTTNVSPVTQPQCGAVLRVSPDGKQSEVVAHGFRNPYDLAFGPEGNLFTVDADGERDQHLPWYSPTRLFDIAPGMHHGWMLQGWQKSWNRPPWFPDNVERLVEVGRGSPTGVIVYRHRQFPERFRNNVFSCCWTLGRVYHFPLERHQSSFRATKENFLETTGDVGFAPVDLAVGPDGDLFVAIGGRRTRGSVFRVRYKGGASEIKNSDSTHPGDELARVLTADEPLAAWSRARWMPLARTLGRDAFVRAAFDPRKSVSQRIRAIEILTELFEGVPLRDSFGMAGVAQKSKVQPGPATPDLRKILSNAADQPVIPRVLWSLSRRGPTVENPLLAVATGSLSLPSDLPMQLAAWQAIATSSPGTELSAVWRQPYPSTAEDRRVRFARITALARHFSKLDRPEDGRPQKVLAWLWHLHFRGKLEPQHAIEATELLMRVESQDELLEAIRLIQLAVGDVETSDANPDVLPGYAARGDVAIAQRKAIADALRSIFPDESREANFEIARLCAMLKIQDEQLVNRIADRFTSDSPVIDDLHYLLVLSFIHEPKSERRTSQIAAALVGLALKMDRDKLYASRNWPLRVGEMFVRLCNQDPDLPAAVYSHPEFGHPGHALLVKHMPTPHGHAGARKLLNSIESSDREWTPELVHVASLLPRSESLPRLRQHWDNFASRDTITEVLAREPESVDRQRFAEALSSAQPGIVEAAAEAFYKLKLQPTEEEWLTVMKNLKRFMSTPQNESVRKALAKLVSQWSAGDAPAKPVESKDPQVAYRPYLDWFSEKHSNIANQMSRWSDDAKAWQQRLAAVPWDQGDAVRGRLVFEKRACQRCHSGSGPLGPDLAGAASRFSRDDLFAHIIDPNKEVSPLYQTTQVVTAGGRVVVGLIVYESPESTLVQTGPDTTVRIVGEEITSMVKSNQSLMPVGLLNEATGEELGDLYAYLQTLKK